MSINEQLLEEIRSVLVKVQYIPEEKKYWLIRTQAGEYYESFVNHGFVALEHERVTLAEINNLAKKFGAETKTFKSELRKLCAEKYPNDNRPGLIGSQLMKFIFQLKKDDVVIIPAESSENISIGVVTNSEIPVLSKEDLTATGCDYKKRKSVKWIRTIRRKELDPYLYRVLQAHQAINDLDEYSDIIERNIKNFYVRQGEANLVLEVEQEDDINARQLFQMGLYLLNYSQNFFDTMKLGLSTDEVEVKINLNSKGKIQLKSSSPSTLWLIAVLAVAVNGGGLKVNLQNFNLDLSTNGVIQKVIDYQNNQHDREIVDTLMKDMDSLKVKSPDDAVKMLQQFSTNKKSSQ